MIRRPARLRPGALVGIVSPASPVDALNLQAGIDILRAHGFGVQTAPHALDRYGHMAGTDDARAADFAAFYADPAIDLLWCACGGSSSCRLWPLLPWDTLAALPPKLVIGYSDVTSLHLPLMQRVQTASLHGPMVSELAGLPANALRWLMTLLFSTEDTSDVPGRASDVIVPGRAEGMLTGGCLSLLCATLGTPYQWDTHGKLLLLEDINEAPHRIERYLVQLREAGLLADAAGFIVGAATGVDDSNTLPLAQIWSDLLSPFGKPAVSGFPFGHVRENFALPLGLRARLDADRGTIRLLQSTLC